MSASLPFFSDSIKTLRLAAGQHDDLNWVAEREKAVAILEDGYEIVWEIDFRLERIFAFDSTAFFSHMRALEEAASFISAIPTRAICVYNGVADLFSLFPYVQWEEAFQEWLDELSSLSFASHELRGLSSQERRGEGSSTALGRHYFRLFCFQCLAEYLERIVSVLPENLLPFAVFDMRSLNSPAYAAQLLSSERFTHLSTYGWLGEKMQLFPKQPLPPLALYLPLDSHCDRSTLSALDTLIRSYREKGTPFRILSEGKLTQEWEGLDRIVVLEETVSSQGMRKLQGFAAAGGEIIYPE